MKNTFIYFFALLLLLLQVKSTDRIVGKWEAVQTTKGGLGSTLEFKPDGSLVFTFGPLLNGTYKLEGSRLIVNTFQPDGTRSTATHEIKIEGDTLIENINGMRNSLTRLTPVDPSSSPIVGKWEPQFPIYEFRRDGSLIVEGMFDATYKLDGNHISVTAVQAESKDKKTEIYEVRFEGDILFWKTNDGVTLQMNRVSPREAYSPPIIGRWRPKLVSGADLTAVKEYKKNGEWTWRFVITSSKGRYSINGDLLTTILYNETKVSRLRFEKGLLVLRSPPEGGPEDKFKRVE